MSYRMLLLWCVEFAENEENSTLSEVVAVETMSVVNIAEQSISDINDKQSEPQDWVQK